MWAAFRAASCPSKEWACFLTLYPLCCEDMVPRYGSYVLYTESHSTSPGPPTSRLLHYWEINTLLAIYATCSLSICQRSLVYILFLKFIYFNWRLITLQYYIGLAIHQHESATGIHVFLHPEPPSHLPPRTIPLGHPSAPAPSIQYPALKLDWWFISYMILYIPFYFYLFF